jgi:hypothetical protein
VLNPLASANSRQPFCFRQSWATRRASASSEPRPTAAVAERERWTALDTGKDMHELRD